MIYRDKHFKDSGCPVYKYELVSKMFTPTGITGRPFKKPFIHLDSSGLMTQYPGWRWDGCSWLAIDTEKKNIFHGSTMHAGCAHDALYQALRESWMISDRLINETYLKRFNYIRRMADVILREQLKKDGVWYIRRNSYYATVRIFGEKYALPEKLK